ncbi:family 20 glycosylhydrolase [Microbacterium saccharophilum]|uniref:beta-N-acetylhexosaminidase n=1 Tax=Microbacterium saccharophilum TaxID=1213358 RepID=A0A5C8I7V1_9MICO|nr:family 20 glycosylhydrolase [Microbacterium saccharophilum]GEP47855.1 beta-N-acetylhexosaminidase [Microbacterium saccharophilum]
MGRSTHNRGTVSEPSLVPTARLLRAGSTPPFAVTPDAAVSGPPDAVRTLREAVRRRTGLDLAAAAATDAAVTLAIDPETGAAESYVLDVDAASVRLRAADAAGLFYGVHTLVQLLAQDESGWVLPAVHVDDAPRFAYRGVMLDVARHFHGAETVKAYIERAAALKFNVLHLHLTDDQGWRIEVPSRPELTARASASAVGGDPGGFFSRADYRAIVVHAAAHHMTVVPEIDVPGHTHAVNLAYPEACAAPTISDHLREEARQRGEDLPASGIPYEGIAVGFSSLRIHDDATYALLSDVLADIAEMTPGPYLHVGGDEALGTPPADLALFMERATRVVADLGKTPIAWHEAGAAAGLAPGTIGQYWGFRVPTDGMDDHARAFVRGGGQLILSPADVVYLDMKPDADFPLGLTWANGPTSLPRAYDWDPAAVIAGVGDDEILGVEAPLWTETVRDLADLDALAFPRIAAAAEAAWSPAPGADERRTWESFRERVAQLAPLWTRQGIGFTPLPEVDWTRE